MCKQDSFNSLKTLTALSTVIFCLTGMALISMGVTKYEQFSLIAPAIGLKYTFLSLLVMFLGASMVAASFFGFVAQTMAGYRVIMIYFYLMLCIFIAQISFGAYALLDEHLAQCQIQQALKESILSYSKNAVNRTTIDIMESHLRCCGLDGPSDYKVIHAPVHFDFAQTLPASCCQQQRSCTFDSGNFWLKGCFYEVSRYTLNALHNIGTLMMASSSITAMSAMIVYVHGLVFGQQYI